MWSRRTATKITGEEERYSHLDLVDFEANVEGALAAFEAVRPLVKASDSELVSTIDERFTAVNDALAPHRRDESFVSYKELTHADTRKLSQVIDALAEPLFDGEQVGGLRASAMTHSAHDRQRDKRAEDSAG
ncbi:MAG TPA: EfeM/EfeO family lipoprotein [Acidimicrobiia bacterium]